MNAHRQLTTFALAAIALLGFGTSAFAQTTIDQNKALAGNVTPGDAAGFPITISQPGSYILKSNLAVPAGVNGIEITAPNVTLDLNGFSVVGPTVCTGQVAWEIVCQQNVFSAGIRSNEQATVIRNGRVSGFNNGVALGADGTRGGYRVEDVSSTGNTLYGFNIMGGTGLRLQASYNGGTGIGGKESMIIDSTASYNKNTGFSLGDAVLRGSRAFGNLYGVQQAYGKVGFESSFIQAVTAPLLGAPIGMGSNLCNGVPC